MIDTLSIKAAAYRLRGLGEHYSATALTDLLAEREVLRAALSCIAHGDFETASDAVFIARQALGDSDDR